MTPDERAKVRAEERERCAKVVETARCILHDSTDEAHQKWCDAFYAGINDAAAAIRALNPLPESPPRA